MVCVCMLKLWRRIYSEATLEASLLAEKWKLVLAGLIFQVLARKFHDPLFRYSLLRCGNL